MLLRVAHAIEESELRPGSRALTLRACSTVGAWQNAHCIVQNALSGWICIAWCQKAREHHAGIDLKVPAYSSTDAVD